MAAASIQIIPPSATIDLGCSFHLNPRLLLLFHPLLPPTSSTHVFHPATSINCEEEPGTKRQFALLLSVVMEIWSFRSLDGVGEGAPAWPPSLPFLWRRERDFFGGKLAIGFGIGRVPRYWNWRRL